MLEDKNFNFEFNQKINSITFAINTRIYSLAAVYQAAYLFLDRVYVFLDGDPEIEVKVVMKLKPASVTASAYAEASADRSADLEKIAGEFYNELLNQLLRDKLSESNARIREYIVSAALFNAVPNEVDKILKEVEAEDWQEDPLGIAKTWSPSTPNGATTNKEESTAEKKGETE